MVEANTLMDIRDLKTYFQIEGKWAKAVDGINLSLAENEVFGLVGESGSGKSVTALSVLRLIPDPPGRILGGRIFFRGQDLLALPIPEMRRIRGQDISMIFQDPMTSLNPVYTVGFQLMEVFRIHRKMDRKAARKASIEYLKLVEIPDSKRLMKEYPHQLSGGMRQRVMIAMALALDPALLIADEPTTALDVTIQAQILDLMLSLKRKKGASILLITHDLAVIAETCDRVAVMYGGKIQEEAGTRELFGSPMHPYTRGLLQSLPRTDRQHKQERLKTIEGIVPAITELPAGCKFCTRCTETMEVCRNVEPDLFEVHPGHKVRCHLYWADEKPPAETT